MPSIEIVYVVVSQSKLAKDFAARFVASFGAYPPLYPYKLTIVCNGGEPDKETRVILELLDCEIKPRENDASLDFGAYYEVAGKTDADLLVCLGESCYFHRKGWLIPLAAAYHAHGPGMYGLMSSHLLRPHLNTTCFSISPKLLIAYPKPSGRAERYGLEHGEYSLWRSLRNRKLPTKFVTWDGVWDPPYWRDAQNILWRGDQSNLLAWCNHTDRWFNADARTKSVWSMHADKPFK